MIELIKHKAFILAAAAASAAAILAVSFVFIRTDIRTRRMEAAITESKKAAGVLEKKAAEIEKESHSNKEKIAYLESKLAALSAETDKQDEKLEKLGSETDAARRDYYRVRSGANRTNKTDKTNRK